MSGERVIRTAVADDSNLFREGLVRLLAETGFSVEGTAGDGEALLALIDDKRPDVAIVDIRMPPTYTIEGLVAAATIRARYPDVGVLVLSQYMEAQHAVRLLEDGHGGVGYLLKDRVADIQDLGDAIRRVAAKGTVIDPEVVAMLIRRTPSGVDGLTEREREILALMAEGRSNQAISERLFLSPKTVGTHVGHIFTKLDLHPGADDHRRVLAVLAYLRA